LLAGTTDPELFDRASSRLATFVANLRVRIAEKSSEELQQLLAKDWKGAAEIAIELAFALRSNQIKPL
jgi:lauroyl/myristoyl acyltransferase